MNAINFINRKILYEKILLESELIKRKQTLNFSPFSSFLRLSMHWIHIHRDSTLSSLPSTKCQNLYDEIFYSKLQIHYYLLSRIESHKELYCILFFDTEPRRIYQSLKFFLKIPPLSIWLILFFWSHIEI